MSGRDRRARFTRTPDMLQRVDGLEPCQRVPHEPHHDEHGSCPGYELTAADERRVDELLEAAHFDVGLDDNDGGYWSDRDR